MFAFDGFRLDLLQILRRLVRRPAEFLLPSAIVAMVVGVGASVFAVVNITMLRPLPFPSEDRLVRVFTMPPGASEVRSRNPLASVDFVRFRERAGTLDRLEAIWERERSLTGGADPIIVKAGNVSSGFFDLLGGRVLLGRTFTAEEDDSANALAVLGHGLWERVFGGDRSIVGKSIEIDGQAHVVIGVMAEDFQPAYRQTELWTPLGVNAHHMPLPNATYLVSVGRLAAGRSVADAGKECGRLMEELSREAANRRGWSAGVATLREYQFGERRGPLLVVAALAILLLALAATNLTSVTLARTIARRDEFATRANIGAGRADLFRPVCLETLVIYGIGAAGGLLFAGLALPLILSLDPETARVIPTTLDGRVVLAAFGAAGLLGCVSDIAPAWSALRRLDTRPSGVRATHSRRARRLQAGLVALQTAIAVTVLVVGGALLESFWRLSRVDPGFRAEGLVTAQVRLTESYASHEERIAFMDSLLEAIRRNPDIAAASSVSSPFVPGFTYGSAFEVENRPAPDGQMHRANFRRISTGYFQTLNIPLQEGRDFSRSDQRTAPWVAIVSRSLANQVWPHESPIGHRIRRAEPGTGWMTIVGIVGDVKDVSLNEGPDPTLYVCQEQHFPATLPIGLVVRTKRRTSAAAPEIRAAMASLDRRQVVDRFLPMREYLSASLSSDRFRTALASVFAVTGLLLVLVGLGGLTAQTVAERTQEIGVRLALGAGPSRLWLATTSDALESVIVGVAAGTIMAVMTFRMMRAALPGVAAPSPLVWTTDIGMVLILCALAAGIPARRVTAIDPCSALRAS